LAFSRWGPYSIAVQGNWRKWRGRRFFRKAGSVILIMLVLVRDQFFERNASRSKTCRFQIKPRFKRSTALLKQSGRDVFHSVIQDFKLSSTSPIPGSCYFQFGRLSDGTTSKRMTMPRRFKVRRKLIVCIRTSRIPLPFLCFT
jgi:hypothetical protein